MVTTAHVYVEVHSLITMTTYKMVQAALGKGLCMHVRKVSHRSYLEGYLGMYVCACDRTCVRAYMSVQT